MLHQNKPILFVMTVIAEHQKKSGAGFNKEFPLPLHQKIEDMIELQKCIRTINPNCQFLFMEHYTESTPKIELVNFKKDDFIWIKHASFQRNTGVFFKDKTDDQVAKILYNSLKV
ncbi:MAG: hypothetical protein Q7U08_02460 [Flavobacteriaceae bacterium]|jgi:hypothetical protein|nr:hypothetical protein [Flavobacteriaceae bacterium]